MVDFFPIINLTSKLCNCEGRPNVVTLQTTTGSAGKVELATQQPPIVKQTNKTYVAREKNQGGRASFSQTKYLSMICGVHLAEANVNISTKASGPTELDQRLNLRKFIKLSLCKLILKKYIHISSLKNLRWMCIF